MFNAAQIWEAEAIGAEALGIVEARYGSGYPHYLGGEQGGLAYHNRHHSLSVQQGTETMGRALGLSATEIVIGRVAAAAHDIVQLKDRGVMEQESAGWLEGRMANIFPVEVAKIGALAILGTEPVFEDGRLTGQVVSRLAYPSRSAELIAKSVACGDFGELHSARGPLLGHELYKEIQGLAPANEPNVSKLIGFQRGQLWLAQNYEYPHEMGERVFGGLRGRVVDYSADILDQLEAGQIDSWQELIERDTTFMRSYS